MTHAHVSEVISPEVTTVHERRLTTNELPYISADLRHVIELTPEEQTERFDAYTSTLSADERAELYASIDGYRMSRRTESRTYLGAMAAEAVVNHAAASSFEGRALITASFLQKVLIETAGHSSEDKRAMLDEVMALLDGEMADRMTGAALRIIAEKQARLEAAEKNLALMTDHAAKLSQQIEDGVGTAVHNFVATYQNNPDVLENIAEAVEAIDAIDITPPALVHPKPTTAELESIVQLHSDERSVSTPPYVRLGMKAVEILSSLKRK